MTDTATKPIIQASGVHHMMVGDIAVSAINDGTVEVSFDDIVDADPGECEKVHRSEFRSVPPWLTINTFLIRTGGKLALVDAGFGGDELLVGRLVENLATIGVAPDDIDVILMTHFHPDHEIGLTDADGNAVFTKAEVFVHETELAFWLDDAELERSPEVGKGDFALARTAIAAYRDRITTVTDGEVLPGVRAFPTPGHTPGHTAWMVESAGESLLIWGDIIHLPGVQFALPHACVAFDLDAPAAAAERKRVLDIAAKDRLMVAGVHLDFPSFGHVTRAGSGYTFVPAIWKPVI